MQYRALSHAIIPVHISGMRAPAIMISASSYEEAKKEAKKKCHLVMTYPDLWRLI